jgi:hypothetical protein
MKKIIQTLGLLLSLLFFSQGANGQANVQIIHNSADPAAAIVDIYVNGDKTGLDDVAFRTATSYLPLPTNTDINVSINASTSIDVNDGVIKTFELGMLEPGNYVVIANGVADASGFVNPNPERDIELALFPSAGKQQSDNPSEVELKVFHGVTDAPPVDIYIKNLNAGETYTNNPQIGNLIYGEATEYIALPGSTYAIKVTVSGEPEIVVGEYLAPVSTAAGFASVVLASGFLNTDEQPTTVNDEASFELNVVTPLGNGGNPLLLPEADIAKVKVIHNSPDPAAETVDIYVNGVKPPMLDDLMFREATPYLDVLASSANIPLSISINGPNSTNSGEDIIEQFTFPALETDMEYIVLANGVAGDGFNSGAADRVIDLDLVALEGRSTASSDDVVAINAFHGSTDAPEVDIYTDISTSPLIPNLIYGTASGWVEIPDDDLNLTVTAAGDISVVAGVYEAFLSAFSGESLFIFASGFLMSEDEPGMPSGRDFGLFVVRENGDVLRLGSTSSIYSDNPATEIYPNPAQGYFTINSEDSFDIIRVIDNTGKIISEINTGGKTNSFSFDNLNLNTGSYYIIIMNDTQTVSLEKLIVE